MTKIPLYGVFNAKLALIKINKELTQRIDCNFCPCQVLHWINWKRLLFRVDFCCLFGNQSSDWLSVDMGLLLYSLVLSLSFILFYLHFTSYIYMSLVLLFSIQQIRFTVPFSWLCFWRKVYARPTWIIVAWLLSHLPRRIPPVTTRLRCLATLLFADSKKGLEKKKRKRKKERGKRSPPGCAAYALQHL